MKTPLARALSEIVEGPFQDTGTKAFDLGSIFPFSWRFVFFSVLSLYRTVNDQSLKFQKMQSHFATSFLR